MDADADAAASMLEAQAHIACTHELQEQRLAAMQQRVQELNALVAQHERRLEEQQEHLHQAQQQLQEQQGMIDLRAAAGMLVDAAMQTEPPEEPCAGRVLCGAAGEQPAATGGTAAATAAHPHTPLRHFGGAEAAAAGQERGQLAGGWEEDGLEGDEDDMCRVSSASCTPNSQHSRGGSRGSSQQQLPPPAASYGLHASAAAAQAQRVPLQVQGEPYGSPVALGSTVAAAGSRGGRQQAGAWVGLEPGLPPPMAAQTPLVAAGRSHKSCRSSGAGSGAWAMGGLGAHHLQEEPAAAISAAQQAQAAATNVFTGGAGTGGGSGSGRVGSSGGAAFERSSSRLASSSGSVGAGASSALGVLMDDVMGALSLSRWVLGCEAEGRAWPTGNQVPGMLLRLLASCVECAAGRDVRPSCPGLTGFARTLHLARLCPTSPSATSHPTFPLHPTPPYPCLPPHPTLRLPPRYHKERSQAQEVRARHHAHAAAQHEVQAQQLRSSRAALAASREGSPADGTRASCCGGGLAAGPGSSIVGSSGWSDLLGSTRPPRPVAALVAAPRLAGPWEGGDMRQQSTETGFFSMGGNRRYA